MNEFTIYVVEDDEEDAFFLRKAIGSVDSAIRLVHFPHGQALLDYLTRRPLQTGGLILLDLHMGEMDGFDTLRQLRHSYWADQLPVFILTVSQSEHDIQRAYALGVNAYLFKPDSVEQLTQVIKPSIAYAQNLTPHP